MPFCVVKECRSKGRHHDPNTMLHSFPKDQHLIKRWLEQLPQDEEETERLFRKIKDGNEHSTFRVCSKHFTPDSYYVTAAGNKRLHKLALPTVFIEDPSGDSLNLRPYRKKRKATACPTCRRAFAEPEKVDAGVQTDDLYPGREATSPDSKDGIIDSITNTRTILPPITVKQENYV